MSNRKYLKNYIIKNMGMGIPGDATRQELLKIGWPENDVKRAFDSLADYSQTIANPSEYIAQKNSKAVRDGKRFIFFIVTGFFLLLIWNFIRDIKFLEYTIYFVIFIFIAYYLALLLDRFIAARSQRTSFKDVGKKEARMAFRFVVGVIAFCVGPGLALAYITKEGGFLFYPFFMVFLASLYAFLEPHLYKKNALCYKIKFPECKQWAEKNDFLIDTKQGLKRRYRENDFYASYDKLYEDTGYLYEPGHKKTIFSHPHPFNTFILIKQSNPLKKSIAFSGGYELWKEIGPEHLEFIKKNSIDFFSTKDWFVARIRFGVLREINIETLFEIMADILKETKYRMESGFEYTNY